MCHPHYSQIIKRTAAEVIADLHDVSIRTNHEFWADDITLCNNELIRADHIQGPRQITDVYLLALAIKHGGCLATFDAGIPLDAVIGATSLHLVLI